MMFFFFFFNDTATTEIYTLSLHDALPIYDSPPACARACSRRTKIFRLRGDDRVSRPGDRKSTRLNSSHANISYAVFCLKKKKIMHTRSLLLGWPYTERQLRKPSSSLLSIN